jgi:DNA-binding protein HU-beta
MAGVNDIAKAAETTGDVVKKVFAAILDAAEKGGSVVIKDFGTFKVKERKARECYNPQNPKEKIKVPAKKIMAFKQSGNLEVK